MLDPDEGWLQSFRAAVGSLLSASPADRTSQMAECIRRIREDHRPERLIEELLRACMRHPNDLSFDIGQAVLCRIPEPTLQYAERRAQRDESGWRKTPHHHRVVDEPWRIILLALAESSLPHSELMPLLTRCARNGSIAVVESAIDALSRLGEMGRPLLQELAASPSSFIRKMALEEVSSEP